MTNSTIRSLNPIRAKKCQRQRKIKENISKYNKINKLLNLNIISNIAMHGTQWRDKIAIVDPEQLEHTWLDHNG